MENAAHTLAGLLIAQAVVAHRRSGSRFAKLAAITSALANNVPDADQLYAGITGGKLGYLLHHRGHTHTLLGGALLGLALAGIVVVLARRKSLGQDDARWLFALGALGPLVHVGMDALNIYGVHPFWPLDNRWHYGDTVFIAEPLFWAVGFPALALTTASRSIRVLLFGVMTVALALTWLVSGLVPLGARLSLIGVALVMTAACWRAPERHRALIGLGAFAAVAALFFVASNVARRHLQARLPADAVTHDIALSALPANPWCWMATTVQTTGAGDLVLRRATVALTDLQACPQFDDVPTAPLTAVTARADATVRWNGEHRIPVARLRELARDHCEVAALLRFVRVPFLREEGDQLIIGDLRFDRGSELGFAELELAEQPASCPAFVPAWTPPRSDVIHSTSSGR